MELKDQIKVYKKNKWAIVFITFLIFGLTLVLSLVKKSTYDVSLAFTINRINRSHTTDYDYGGYYDLLATERFADTIDSWLTTPAFIQEIYKNAGLEIEENDLVKIKNKFNIKKLSAQNLQVNLTEKEENEADAVAKSIVDFVEKMTKDANKNAEDKPLFEAIGTEPIIVESRPNVVLNSVIAIIVGFGLSLLLVNFKEYLREELK